jgi:hypothetical protein
LHFLIKVTPLYRELNIMNRVLNKDFSSKSYKNSTLISFSDVFFPSSCMQSRYLSKIKESDFLLFFSKYTPYTSCTSRVGESDEEW